jgi:hypothetical protein
LYVSDLIPDIQSVLGRCTDDYLLRRVTDAVKLANNQGKFDICLGIMDLCVCDGYVTLPAFVGTVLAVNNEGYPTLLRDQWFQYHANSAGTDCVQPWGYTNEEGMVSIWKDPQGQFVLASIVENPKDSNCLLRAYGWDITGKRIYTADSNGDLQDGFLVPTTYGSSSPATSVCAKIDRVQKGITNGFVRLMAFDPISLQPKGQIGYYLPWETDPYYRRIRVPRRTSIRIKYRKRDLEVLSTSDWINIENREALLLLLKSVKFRLDNQIDQAKVYELEGMRLLSNEAEALRPPGISPPIVIFSDGIVSDWTRDELNLHY